VDDFDTLFTRATGAPPYPYQRRLALAPALPEALSAPTGAGKTAAVALAWLYRRRFADAATRAATPRRLVLCLPMRTLVSQTDAAVRAWLSALGLLDAGAGLARGDGVGVHMVMGGAVDDDWHLHPERDAVLIGTQDMLLSRALNRGYAASRFHWPWEYGLLANDVLWVFDEVQLMGVGLATGLQLAALGGALGAFGPRASLFMSATMERAWLETVDHPAPAEVFTLGADDLAAAPLDRRRRAPKRLARSPVALDLGDRKRTDAGLAALAQEVLDRHVPGTRTLVVLNRVALAVGLHDAMAKAAAKKGVARALLHSRFRPPEREAAVARATAKGFDGVVVATQVVEAGVDMTSRTLFTELAPWASLVQRAGRCNRGGEEADATVWWVDHADEPDEKLRARAALPYKDAELRFAREHLAAMDTFNPEAIAARGVTIPLDPPPHVLRRRDVLDLFDTTPDLGGVDLDVSRFIRDGEGRDAQVFWRAGVDPAKGPSPKARRPRREELCSVPFHELREALAKRAAWRWDAVDGEWVVVKGDAVYPGLVLMLRAEEGGYDPARGWDPSATDAVTEVPLAAPPPEGDAEEALGDDPLSELRPWVSLVRHSTDARDAAREIVGALAGLGPLAEVVVRAAHAHDAGKAHAVFQETMRRGYEGTDPGPWAKSGSHGSHTRKGFRHELASALVWLAHGDGDERDLVAYLLAAHHGKVRLSIRAMPEEKPAPDGRLFARGVYDGDEMPAVDLGDGVALPATTLSLAVMNLGRSAQGASWAERALALRGRLGPFRLAFLEALVRAADVRASMREAKG